MEVLKSDNRKIFLLKQDALNFRFLFYFIFYLDPDKKGISYWHYDSLFFIYWNFTDDIHPESEPIEVLKKKHLCHHNRNQGHNFKPYETANMTFFKLRFYSFLFLFISLKNTRVLQYLQNMKEIFHDLQMNQPT